MNKGVQRSVCMKRVSLITLVLCLLSGTYAILNKQTLKRMMMLWLGVLIFQFVVGCTNTSLNHISDGTARYDESRDGQAISGKTKVVEINRRLSISHYNRGVLHATESRYDLAILDYNQAIKADPEFTQPYFARATAYHMQGKYDLAISDYDQAIAIDPMYAAAYDNRGVAYADKGQYDRAISDYNKAVEINPTLTKAYNNLKKAYDGKGQHDRRLIDFVKATDKPKGAREISNQPSPHELDETVPEVSETKRIRYCVKKDASGEFMKDASGNFIFVPVYEGEPEE
jgi:tetratricopeptide (TPR) repeat protein